MNITLLKRIKELDLEATEELNNIYSTLGTALLAYIPSPKVYSDDVPSRDFAVSISAYLADNPIESLDELGIDKILTAIDNTKKNDKGYRDAAKEAYGILTSDLTASYLGWNLEKNRDSIYQFPEKYAGVEDISVAINKALEEANGEIKESGFQVKAKLRRGWKFVAELYLVDENGNENVFATAQYFGDRFAATEKEADGHSDVIQIKDDYLFSIAKPFEKLKDYLPKGEKYLGISDILAKVLSKI